MLGTVHWMLVEDIPQGIDHARDALVTATRLGDPAIVMRAATTSGSSRRSPESWTGTIDRLEGVVPLEAGATGTRFLFRPSYDLALLLDWADRLNEARASWLTCSSVPIGSATRTADRSSWPIWRPRSCPLAIGSPRPAILMRRSWPRSSRAMSRRGRYGLPAGPPRGVSRRHRWAAPRRGGSATRPGPGPRSSGTRSGRRSRKRSYPWATLQRRWRVSCRSLIGLSAAHVRHVPGFSAVPVAAEAAALTGDTPTAEGLLARLLEVGRALDHASTLRAYQRARAQLAATHGRLDDALEAIDAAMEQATRVPEPFERARTGLVRAEILRRLRRRAPARDAAAEALATFETLGARIWAERARFELARAGVPAAGQTGTAELLTPTQREVAGLVAAGRTRTGRLRRRCS